MIWVFQIASENHVTYGRIILLLLKILSVAKYKYVGNDINNSKFMKKSRPYSIWAMIVIIHFRISLSLCLLYKHLKIEIRKEHVTD
jgi:hypothetical protein